MRLTAREWAMVGNQLLARCAEPCLCCPQNSIHTVNTTNETADEDRAHPDTKETDMALRKTPPPLNNGPPPPPSWQDPEFERDFPSIYSFLMDTKYEDGQARVPGSMSIFTHAGALKAAVNDKDRGVVAFVSAPTWDELFAFLEAGICNDSLEWKAGSKGGYGKNPPY